MTSFRKMVGLALAVALMALLATGQESTASTDVATVSVGRARASAEDAIPQDLFTGYVHPVLVEARHPKAGCFDTAACGEVFFRELVHNLRTSAGTTWQSELMGKTTTPTTNAQCNYLGLTNTAVTPAMADTTLSGEISSNGLSRAQATYADGSGVVSVPGTPTLAVQGTAGSTTYYYAIIAVNQGILTTPGTAANVTTANAALSATNYVHVSWTPVTGATSYYVLRNTSNSFTGSMTAVAGRDSTSQPDCSTGTCYLDDIANTLAGTAVTVPGSNLTNYGHFTLVHTWTATAAQSAQAFGAFTASSSGTMCFEGTFTQVSLNTNDTFQLTETVNF